MDSTAQTAIGKPPTWYWVVAGLALVWMIIGLLSLVGDFMTDESALSKMSEAQQQLYRSRPQWIFGVYAIAILSGLAGAIALLMRKAWAVPAFGVSLLAVIVQFAYILLIMDAIKLLGFAAAAAFPLVIFLIAVALLWFAIHARKSGWVTA